MRHSFFRNLVHFTSTHPLTQVLALTAALAGCSGETKGQVILALQTDMSLPEDVSKVKIQVNENGTTRYEQSFPVDPNQPDSYKIPSTLAIVAGEEESPTVELTVIAFRDKNDGSGDLEARTLNKSVTTIPKDRIAMLRVPMQWLCTGMVAEEDGIFESSCRPKNGKETACVGGSCEEVHIDSAKLPNFNEEEVFGGSEKPSNGTCFPTEDCFDAGEDIPLENIDTSDCTVTYDPPSDDTLNFGIVTDGSGGICRNGVCYVGVDNSREFGWYELESSGSERRFKMPQGVCDRLDVADGRATALRASTDKTCLVTKTPKYPTCGPWSGVGKAPEKPPGNDADGDGFDSKESGGKDCDDDDPSVFPGAPEACDLKDNNCDMDVDNACRDDLPFSHYVDFSAQTSGFMSTSDYAIYQTFDNVTPLDLDHKTLTFTPGSDDTTYTVRVGALQWDDDVGELVPVTQTEDVSDCDDCFTELPLEFPFDFYGTEYESVYPSSNGYLTFVTGDEEYGETVEYFLTGFPRIAALFDDLDTRGSTATDATIDDEVRFFSSGSKLVVTYLDIQHFPQSGSSNTFQFVLSSDGTIQISYDGMEDTNQTSLAGISPGSLNGGVTCTSPLIACQGDCVEPNTDPDNCGDCGNVCTSGRCVGGECTGDVLCISSLAPCDGVCVGSCQYDTAATCDGTCIGTCNGTCTPDDGSGTCSGTCEGTCQGSCYLTTDGGSCPDSCTGECYLDAGMTCYDPTPGAKGPCTFSGAQVSDPSYCSDYAYTESGAGFVLTCSDDVCHCCRQGTSSQVCTVMASTPADVCASESSLRQALLDECMQETVCGAGCPTTPPTNGDPCNESEISSCYYPTPTPGVICSCIGNMFSCD